MVPVIDDEPSDDDGDQGEEPDEDTTKPSLKSFALSGHEIAEGAVAGTLIGKLSATSNELLSFALIEGEGDDDNGRFQIESDELLSAELFNFDTNSVFSIRARVTSKSGLKLEAVFEIEVINDLKPAAFSIVERSGITASARPTISWEASGDTDRYTLTVSVDSGCAIVQDVFTNVTTNSQKLNALADGTYYLCVEAYNAESGKSSPAENQPVTLTIGSVALGEADFVSANWDCNANAQDFCGPVAAGLHDGKLFVVDQSNHRVLIWNTIPTSHHQSADLVLGQAGMSSQNANHGGISASSLNSPAGFAIAGEQLVVCDKANHRVLIWDQIPETSFAAANRVLGQADMISNGVNAVTGSAVQSCSGNPASDGTRLVVPDEANHRVLVWNSLPSTNGQSADLVLGQPDMTSNSANQGGIGLGTLNQPSSVAMLQDRLLVSDFGNHRVLIWDEFPASNFDTASIVLGQPDDVSNTASTSGQGLDEPMGIHTFQNELFVADHGNHRVMLWNPFPTATEAGAAAVFGQPDFTSNTANSGGIGAGTLDQPRSAWADDGTLILVDYNNNRVILKPRNN